MATQSGVLHQINISPGGLPKRPVATADVRVSGIVGDRQKNRALHGGPQRALCLFSLERIEALRRQGHTIHPGATGENLTLAGFDWAQVQPGDHLHVGKSLKIELTSFAAPCRHNAQWFSDQDFSRLSQETNPGWSRLYAKVLQEGCIEPGDSVALYNGGAVDAQS